MLRKFKWFFLISIIVTLCSVWAANRVIEYSTESMVYENVAMIPHNKVGLLLGTSKSLKSGFPNLYFSYRIKAAADLFKAGKIDVIVISGDNSRKNYNEPMDMKEELMKQGIPEDRIYLDYAGFRTYDSVVRLEKIFGQKQFTVISQNFHNRRAIYIARHCNLEAIGYNAEDVNQYSGFKTMLREKFARVKVFVDFLIGTEPKFLGERVEIK
ncbi:MAG: YdcF family protein [Bacteroidia bacterium]|nr:YdcF family protein [Bacteroidia bacterium]